MKAKIYLAAALFLMCACKKSQNVVVNGDSPAKVATQSVNNSLIQEVTNLPTYDERKAAYVSMLTAYEKYTVWQTRFQAAIASRAFNAGQLIFINEMVVKITPSFFQVKQFGIAYPTFLTTGNFVQRRYFHLHS